MGTVRHRYHGRYKCKATGVLYFVYKREFVDIGVYEYAFKKDKMGTLTHIEYSDEALANKYDEVP